MSNQMKKNLPESDTAGMYFNETELTLGLPGESRVSVSGTKRGFPDPHSCTATQNKKHKKDSSENGSCITTESPASK